MVYKLIRAVVFGVCLASAAATAGAQTDRSATDAVKDAWITTQIHAKYFADRDVKGLNIDVDTNNGIVTLNGEVHSAKEREQAIADAKSVSGVTQVLDKLTVTPEEKTADKVKGTAGKAAGKAESAADKARGEWPKRKAQGKEASDRVGDTVSDAWITTKIQSKYFLDRDVKAVDINVTTNNGIVTLEGTVDSPAAHQKAAALAKSTDGVKSVVDKLTVK
jgi:hyperosmotically inducible protein